MKLKIKSWLLKALSQGKPLKTFPAFLISHHLVEERVFLCKESWEEDITERHCIVCHDPFCIAVLVSPTSIGSEITIQVRTKRRLASELKADFIEKLILDNHTLALFEIKRASCFQMNLVRQFLLLRYFKNKDTLLQGRIYAALYSYPRKVIIVSYQDSSYYNIFPMDFQCQVEGTNIMILGLRTTNYTIERILNTKRLVVSNSSALNLDTIYQLGRNHSQSPPPLSDLTFKAFESEMFRFPIPENCSQYHELELIQHKKLGTHMLLVCRVINTKQSSENLASIYHLHFFQSTTSQYQVAQ